MAVSFTYVPPVASGDAITSTHRAYLSGAVNDRLRSGLADGSWRIMFYVFSLFRQIRNPDDSGFLFPAQAEFFTAYQNIDPAEYIWPLTGPGDGEGANVASIMPAFVFGAEALDLDSEDVRVADEVNGGVPLWLGLTTPETPEQIWELGKRQRGAYDPNSGYYGAPALTAAIQHTRIRSGVVSPHGNSWGGYMPAPVFLGVCSDPEFPNYEIKFTNLETAAVLTFGTCPDDPAGGAYFRGSRYYYIFLNGGTQYVLPINEWIEGPYTGGSYVTKQSGEHIPRVLNSFASEFRGTDDQVEAQEVWLQHAFDTERFLASQYHLAPANGSGDGTGVGAEYPQWNDLASSGLTRNDGDYLPYAGGGIHKFYHTDFVLASAFIKAHNVRENCSIEFLDDGEVIKTVQIEPDSSGDFSAIVTFDNADTPTPLEIRWASNARFSNSSGYVVVETSELLRYKPELHDLYLCLRLASCRTFLAGDGMDGSGTSEESAAEISDAYFANGCITNARGNPGPAGSFAEINTSAVFDSARRLSKCVRIVPRQNFIGYEVNAEGKSVCYFLRRTIGGADIFDGIGPSRIQVTTGAIRADIQYIVRSGVITYRSFNYVTGQTFTGVHGTTEFQGDGTVYEYDGIRATAPREGETNEWLMGTQLKVSHPSDSSLWKTDSYSDYWFLSERCHFGGAFNDDLKYHFNYGSNLSFAPEAPTGWRYAQNSNDFPCGDPACEAARQDRYRSCRIYEPDPEIESATALMEGTEEVLKLVFKSRFHCHHSTAPATIDRDVSTWDITTLNAESYRTVENGLREYLVWAHTGAQCTRGGTYDTGQQGNGSPEATVWTDPDNPYGACFPHFYFVKLLPKVYEDSNDTQDAADTKLTAEFWQTLELYIRAMCEGYVDGLTSTTIGCETGVNALFDYNLQSLCFEAFGGKWFNTLATTETQYLENVRSEGPQGFGQLPNTSPAAEIYNQFASALNLMNRVRVMLPLDFEVKTDFGTPSQSPVQATESDGTTPLICGTVGAVDGYWSGTPPGASAGSGGTWASGTSASSVVFAGMVCDTCDGDNWLISVSRDDSSWRWTLTDPDSIHAIPTGWQDMLSDSSALRLLGIRTRTKYQVSAIKVSDIAESENCDGLGHWIVGSEYLRFQHTLIESYEACEIISASGTVSAPPLGKGDIAIGRSGGGDNCCSGFQNDEGIEPILGQDVAFIEVPLV